MLTNLFGSVSTFLIVKNQGVQGDGVAVPLHKYNTAVTRRLHAVKAACLRWKIKANMLNAR